MPSERLSPALEASGFLGTWTLDAASGLVILDGEAAELLAGSAEFAGRPLDLDTATSRLHPDDRARVLANEILGQLLDGCRAGFGATFDNRFSESDDALVRMDFEEQPAGLDHDRFEARDGQFFAGAERDDRRHDQTNEPPVRHTATIAVPEGRPNRAGRVFGGAKDRTPGPSLVGDGPGVAKGDAAPARSRSWR